jgi:golgi phosphoprotein 3
METSVTSQFIILALHPEKGRKMIDNIHFRYTLIGSVLMDFLEGEEVSLNNKRLIPDFRRNGEIVHDMISDKIGTQGKPRRISFWIRRLSIKSRFIFKETINLLINKGIYRHERRYFLNIFPYDRYFLTERGIRTGIIDGVRDVILHEKSATGRQIMLIGLINASRSWNILVKEKGERWMLRRKCNEFMKSDAISSEIDQTIKEIQTAIISSILAASAAAAS